jgi:hypothetical protein
MNFKNRILYYLIGFLLGLSIVLSVIGVRGCEWLPENRILQAISKTQIYVHEHDLENITCNNSKAAIFDLLSNGEIIFNKSETKKELKKYYIEHKGLSLILLIDFQDSTSKIKHINGLKTCVTIPKKDSYVPLYLSNEKTLTFLKEQPLKTEENFNCNLKCHHLDSIFFNKILIEGEVLFNKSKPKKRPNPLFIIKVNHENDCYLILVQQGEKRTRFKKLIVIEQAIENLNKDFFNNFLSLNNKTQTCDCNN